tara:strand:- start:62 stop:472 length:411 start_codon:yes stop_codon:yes gene_type:complete
MMSVLINGRIKQKKKVEDFVYSTLFDLMPRLKRTVYIDVNVVTKCDNEYYALCHGDKEEIFIELARESDGNKFTLDEMMLHLAHELVHAKQFLKGELHPNLSKWYKKDCSNLPYRQTPWEKEAYLLEQEIINKHWK